MQEVSGSIPLTSTIQRVRTTQWRPIGSTRSPSS